MVRGGPAVHVGCPTHTGGARGWLRSGLVPLPSVEWGEPRVGWQRSTERWAAVRAACLDVVGRTTAGSRFPCLEEGTGESYVTEVLQPCAGAV